MNRRQLIATGGVTALLGGCISIGDKDKDATRFFELSPKSGGMSDAPLADWQLIIEPPSSSAALSGTRIAVKRSAFELEYFARANWTDAAPAMLQTLIVESFENSGRIIAVGRESIGLRADFILKTELREFQVEIDEGGDAVAHVGVTAKLVAMPRRAIVAHRSDFAKSIAASDRVEDVVNAFDDALGQLLKKLVIWTLEEGHQHQR
ncbi:ABC-type transport auxiliary lipoprotein family protein [Gammaproteobacteria bacterium]|nr:ABC-type transport auxiliary lipoprotein family protein [Gammaproteobacteria bacterium]